MNIAKDARPHRKTMMAVVVEDAPMSKVLSLRELPSPTPTEIS